MINQDVLNYIRGQVALGVSRDAIKNSLKTGGWSEADMVEAFAAIDGVRVPPPPPPAPPPPPHLQRVEMQPRPTALPSLATISSAPARERRGSTWPWVLLLFVLILAGLAAAMYFWYPGLVEKYLGTGESQIENQEPLPIPMAPEQNNTTININIPQATSTATTTVATTTSTTTP